jgi:hypothetical protein
MTQFIALVALIVLGMMSTLGNFWFTYGIWPRSWGSFALFGVINLIISMAISGVLKEIRGEK